MKPESDPFLNLKSRFVSQMPGDPEAANFTRPVSNITHSETRPTPVSDPALIAWSLALSRELSLDRPSPNSSTLNVLSGNLVHPEMKPYASRYGGHQFGHWAGQLGDGRAISLGELPFKNDQSVNALFNLKPKNETVSELTVSELTVELQLKGAGPTPYSRRADGRAVLRSSLREYLCSEAMFHLGVPTTRALSLITTGDLVTRDLFYDGNPKDEPGAIVCRVSPTFLRFGNFEILGASEETELLKKLADFLITDHFPELDLADPDVYGKYLDEISRRSAEMVIHWMRVGFVHGVMNTDNMSDRKSVV